MSPKRSAPYFRLCLPLLHAARTRRMELLNVHVLKECENMVEAAICCLSRDADLKGFRKDDVEKSKVIVIITYPILNKFFFM